MLLQGDKPGATLTRERASRVLFDTQDTATAATRETAADTFVNFAYDHNVAEFRELVQNKYPQVINPEDSAGAGTGTGANFGAGMNTDTTQEAEFNKYYTPDAKYESPREITFNRYYNDANPIPYQTFKPKMLTDFEDVQIDDARGFGDRGLLQKIDEVQILEPVARPQTAAALDRDEATEPYLKLNAKGIIACVAFVAVTLLIVLLVIINSVAIGGAGTKIKRLQDENTELSQQLNTVSVISNDAYQKGVAAAKHFAETDGVEPETIYLPPIASYQAVNPDKSTNFFDWLARVFGSIFS